MSIHLSLRFERTTRNVIRDAAEYPREPQRQSRLHAPAVGRLKHRVQEVLSAISDLLESRFAKFADVPYQDLLTRRQWEYLWESESDMRRIHEADLYAWGRGQSKMRETAWIN